MCVSNKFVCVWEKGRDKERAFYPLRLNLCFGTFTGSTNNMEMTENENTLRVSKATIIGDSFVGKTYVISRWVENKFPNTQATNGASFCQKQLRYNGTEQTFLLWDTPGDEKLKDITYMYVKYAHVVIIMYDITEVATFLEVNSRLQKVKEYSRVDNFICVIAGNKLDLENNRQIPKEDGKKYADSIGALFFEVSAKTSENVDKMFQEILVNISIRRLYRNEDLSTFTFKENLIRKNKRSKCY